MSVNAVDQTTGNTTPLAGNTNNLVGNLSALTTNTKSDAVGAINEVNANKQNATDNNLQTTDKTIVGGINELRSGLTNQGTRLTTIENGTVTSAGTSTVGNTIELPQAAKVVYIRADINGYYYTPMCLVRGNHINIPICVSGWIATITLNYNNDTRLWTFESETTIAGTKNSQWNTNVEVFYS